MAGSGSDGLAELTAEELADLPDFTPNIYKVVRALRKDDHGPYNCLASIVHDAAFVKGVVREYRLPTFANLRCGLWYAGRHHAGNESWAGPSLPGEEDEPLESEDGGLGEDAERTRGEEEDDVRAAIDGTCYFKSTDGHCNNWSFSGTRLNVHVAETAARRGGCVIVDATRSTTKRFPDSFSKTVPIWAETLNRAVRDARRRARADASAAFLNETNVEENSAWDASSSAAGAAFPPWVGEQERERIRELFPLFSKRLEAVSPDLSKLVKTLKAPLRCVWVSRETAARGLPLLTELNQNENENKPALAFTPVVLVSASSPMQWHGERRVGRDGRSFAYVPGAGDDEESWARGLNPDAFWRNRNFILNEGPMRCVERVDDVVGRDAVSLAKEKRAEANALIAESLRSPLQSPSSSSSSSIPAWEVAGSSDARRAAGGCLSGAGRAAAAAALGATLGAVRDGAVRVLYERHPGFEDDRSGLPSLIGVALGSVKALEKEETWSHARAVLFVGDAPLPPIVENGVSRKTPPFDVPFLRLEARLHKIARGDFHDALPAALAFIEKHAPLVPFVTPSSKPIDRSLTVKEDDDDEKKKYVLVACNDGADHCAGVAVARAVAADLFLNKKEDTRHGETRTEPAPLVTKDCVRRRLAAVSARHPEASPTRGTLKQVFNYLLDASKGRRADGG